MYKLNVKSDRLSEDSDEYDLLFDDIYSLRAAFDHRFAMAVQHSEYERIEAFCGEKMIALYDRKGIQ